jgi:hypothetical protein
METTPLSVSDLKQKLEREGESDGFKEYLRLTRDNSQDGDKQQLIKYTRVAVWNAILESIDKITSDLQKRKENEAIDDTTKTFIGKLIDGIQIRHEDLGDINKYIMDNFTSFIEHSQITRRNNYRKAMSWYVYDKLKKMGITVVSDFSTSNALSADTFKILVDNKHKLYIVCNPSPNRIRDNLFRTRYTSKVVHLQGRMMGITYSYYANPNTFDDRPNNDGPNLQQYTVAEYDIDTLRYNKTGYDTFLNNIYKHVFNTTHSDEYSLLDPTHIKIEPGALFVYGSGVNTLLHAVEVLFLVANSELDGVKSEVLLTNPTKLKEDKKFPFMGNPDTPDRDYSTLMTRLVNNGGSKKRSSKKTHRGRNKSNNNHKYRARPRSRRSISKYHKKTARKT